MDVQCGQQKGEMEEFHIFFKVRGDTCTCP